jgi:hypothetical protein
VCALDDPPARRVSIGLFIRRLLSALFEVRDVATAAAVVIGWLSFVAGVGARRRLNRA